MKTLKQLIKSKNFDWVNSNIIEDNFPLQTIRSSDYKLFHFDRYISSDNVIKEMEKEGYTPVNIYELLSWKDWNNEYLILSLGSSCEVDGSVRVPCLDGVGSKRRLSLHWRLVDWDALCRFLGVRTLSLTEKSVLGNFDSVSLESRVTALEEWQTKVEAWAQRTL